MNCCDSCEFEKYNNWINIILCKYILGISKYSTDAAVRGELGRYPIAIKLISLSVKYWIRTSSLDVRNIVKLSYIENVCSFKGEKNNWAGIIYHLLNLFEMSYRWENQENEESMGSSADICTIKSHMYSLYSNLWRSHINRSNSNKLRTYAKFKTDFKLENYIAINKCKLRRHFSMLRISAHKLAIETGRYTRPVTNENERICIYCDGKEIENEFHLLFNCEMYTKEREKFFTTLESYCQNVSEPNENNFCFLMNYNNGDTEIAKEVCKYVENCLSIRSAIFTKNANKNCVIDWSCVEFFRLANIQLD